MYIKQATNWWQLMAIFRVTLIYTRAIYFQYKLQAKNLLTAEFINIFKNKS